jgi:type II secretory pathway pseudopilin PulG
MKTAARNGDPQFRGQRAARAFTMVEIAISLAVIGFALVAIIGILPMGLNVQRENREETVINLDNDVLMDAIRNGAQGMDELTNYVVAITNYVTEYYPRRGPNSYSLGYTYSDSTIRPVFGLTNGFRIIGLLSTPKYIAIPSKQGDAFSSNHVVAWVRSMSGPAHEKPPQNNSSVQDLGFNYRLMPEVVPYGTNNFDPAWTNWALFPNTSPDYAMRLRYSMMVSNMQMNLHDVRLLYRWPLLPNGNTGGGRQTFRSVAGGVLTATNDPSYLANPAPTLYFFQHNDYAKAP